MEVYKLEVKDGIITDINNIRTIPGEYEEVNGEVIPKTEEVYGKLYIPKDVTGITNDALTFVSPLDIEVDPENSVFFAKDGCLIKKDDGLLVLASKDATIPNDGSVKKIGDTAFDFCGAAFNPLIIPEGVEELSYRALAVYSDEPVSVVIPKSVKKLCLMSLMASSRGSVASFTVLGDPEIEVGAFGTKGEAMDSTLEIYKSLSDMIYCKNELIKVRCKAGAKLEAYCHKYNIPIEIIN